jgi:hypothetical protein
MKTKIGISLIAASFLFLGAGCAKEVESQIPEKPQPVVETQTTYKNALFAYQISYPKTFTLLDNKIENSDLALAFPTSFTKGTNLGEAKINVSAHKNIKIPSEPACLTHPYTSQPLTETVVQDGQTFYTYNVEDAGAGQRYNYRGYQILKDNVCYTVVMLLHSTVRENYDAINRPIAYDDKAVVDAFDSIFKTFKFSK